MILHCDQHECHFDSVNGCSFCTGDLRSYSKKLECRLAAWALSEVFERVGDFFQRRSLHIRVASLTGNTLIEEYEQLIAEDLYGEESTENFRQLLAFERMINEPE